MVEVEAVEIELARGVVGTDMVSEPDGKLVASEVGRCVDGWIDGCWWCCGWWCLWV